MRRSLRMLLMVTLVSFLATTVTSEEMPQGMLEGFEIVPVALMGMTPAGYPMFIVIPNEFQYCECAVKTFPRQMSCFCTTANAGICVEYES